MTTSYFIGNTEVGAGMPTFIIAEISANHCGSLDSAIQLIEKAASAGANAVKIQTYTADSITLKCRDKDFQLTKGTWKDYGTLWDLYDKARTPYEWHKELFLTAHSLGLEIFSSPFDEDAVDFLESLGSSAYKIASPEINHIPLLRKVANTKKPIILSTGLATLEDIELAVQTILEYGTTHFSLLKCTTSYPAPLEDSDLLSMADLAIRFNCSVGLSDHTLGKTAAIALSLIHI